MPDKTERILTESERLGLVMDTAQKKHKALFLLCCEHDGFDPINDMSFPFTDENPHRDALDAAWREKGAALEAVEIADPLSAR